MNKTKEMFDATHKRNDSFSWNQWYEEQDESLDNIGNWINQDSDGANYALGEDITAAVKEVLDHD